MAKVDIESLKINEYVTPKHLRTTRSVALDEDVNCVLDKIIGYKKSDFINACIRKVAKEEGL